MIMKPRRGTPAKDTQHNKSQNNRPRPGLYWQFKPLTVTIANTTTIITMTIVNTFLTSFKIIVTITRTNTITMIITNTLTSTTANAITMTITMTIANTV